MDFATSHFVNKPANAYFLIFCPGKTAYGIEEAKKFFDAIQNNAPKGNVVEQVGDGCSPLQESDIYKSWDVFKRKTATMEAPCVIFNCHGMQQSREHWIYLGEQWVPTRRIFQRFGTSFEIPMSIFLPACFSNSACHAASALPKGSVLATFGDGDFSGNDVARWQAALTQWPLCTRAVDLLYIYLMQGLKNRFAPVVSVVGGTTLHLDLLLEQHVGCGFSLVVQEALGSRMGKEDVISLLSQRLAGAKSVWSINAVDYGTVLALLLEETYQTALRILT
ncbi:hypothetical protein PG985_005506 [Apiospora marii]|uniref:uncharacterized protein n=1 Tax=Apiospora marii TaxID=335849 RepID=UPI00313249A7